MKNNTFSEELIVRYLLGDLPEEKLAEIEDRAFRDRQFLDEILAAESDLIDEYVRGGLSDSMSHLFDSRFLASAERRRKVEFAKALASVVSETAVIEKESLPAIAREQFGLWDSLAAFLRGLSPTARLSFAAVASLIVIGGSWAVIETMRLRAQLQTEQEARQREQQALEGQLADERARGDNFSSRLQNEREQRERSQEVIRELEREREELATKPTQPTVLSLALLPGIGRSGNNRPKLILPQSARLVRLRIGIEPGDEYKSFRVELLTQAAEQIWMQDNLSARTVRAGRAIVLNLPASILVAGRYELALKGLTDGRNIEDVGYYYFDVVKR